MIQSMTAFGSARAELDGGTVTVELRSVNSRFLDLHLRLPDELRLAEAPLREQLTAALGRGKVEVRASFSRSVTADTARLDPHALAVIARQLDEARVVLPGIEAPRLGELLNWQGLRNGDGIDPQAWIDACTSAAAQALTALQAARQREGERLAQLMRDCAHGVEQIVQEVETHLPQMLADHREKLANKLRDTVAAAFPAGFAHISGTELSERLSQETTLFTLRIDVAEELGRLRAHVAELQHILSGEAASRPASGARSKDSRKPGGSAGKRLDFLFQEMNREANTLGSKSASLEMTRASMDLKLLIEQMREQAQNIE